jgi:hypothetical protein
MANRDELKHKRETDSRVAQLGLAADLQDSPQGSCLSSKEMAELLDGKCEIDQQQLYLAHLSSCETCYREWLDLQQELSRGNVVQKKALIFQRRFLAVSGSLLAAAASVVFFLNLNISPGPGDSPVLMTTQTERKQSPKKLEVPAQQKAATNIAEPATVEQLKPQFDEVQMEAVEDNVEKEEFAAPSDQSSFRAMKKAAPAMTLDPAQEWIQQVLKKCAVGGSDSAGWEDLVHQGQELSPKNNILPQAEIILEKLNRLLAGDARETVCTEIQGIVNENNYE